MKYKRILSLLLIFTALLSFSSFPFTDASAAVLEEKGDYYANRLGLLSSLGVLSDVGEPDDMFVEEQFIKGVLTLIGYDDAIFSLGKTAKELAEERGFYGKASVETVDSLESAYVVLLNALGYGVQAEADGGDISAYLSIASRENLGKNVIPADGLTNRNGVAILYNALFMNMFGPAGNNGYAKLQGTVLEKTFKAHESEGLVTGVYLQALSGSAPKSKDEIAVNNVNYKTDMEDVYSLFGKYVKFYYTDDDEKTLLYAWCDTRSFVTINAPMVTGITQKGREYKIEYEGMKGEKYSKKVTPKYVCLNGELIDYRNENIKDLMDFYTGQIILTDTDQDNNFDCIILEKYENYLVSMVTNKVLYDANGKDPVYLDDEEDGVDDYRYDVYVNGVRGNLSSAMPNDVVSVYRNRKGNIIKLIVASQKTIHGTVDRIVNNNDSRGKKVIVDGFPYFCPTDGKVPELGTSGIFYLDAQDVIVGFEVSDIYTYGYLVAAMQDSPLDGLKIKLCPQGVTGAKEFECTRKLSIQIGAEDAKKYDAEAALNLLKTETQTETQAGTQTKPLYMPGLVKFRTDANGCICAIKLPEDKSNVNLTKDDLSEMGFSEFVCYGQAPGSLDYIGSKLGRYTVNAKEAIVFSIPEGENIPDSEYDGNVQLRDSVSYNRPMYYDIDSFLTAKVVLTFHESRGEGLVYPLENPHVYYDGLSVVKSIDYAYDPNEGNYKVEFTFIGKSGEFKGYTPYDKNGIVYNEVLRQNLVNNPTVYDTTEFFDEDCDKLNVGDVVVVKVDEQNRISGMLRFWSNKRNQLTNSYPGEQSYIDGYMVSRREWSETLDGDYVFAKFIKRNNTVMVLDATNTVCTTGEHEDALHAEYNDTNAYQAKHGRLCVFQVPKSGDPIYVLDKENGDRVRKGTLEDLRAGDDIVFALWGGYKGILVIKR